MVKSVTKRRSAVSKEDQKLKLEQEIASLSARVIEEAPARGYAPSITQTVAFQALPLSNATLRGLMEAKTPFTTMTAIQNACIPHALVERDILGAARTGRYVKSKY
jgi:superfamily II DNA/RNA helicase